MSDLPSMSDSSHLFGERDLRTVTANTPTGGDALLRLAGTLHVAPSVTTSPFERTGAALDDLRAGRAAGSLVVTTV